MAKVSASLVLYHQAPDEFENAITSFLQGSDGELYIIDNSASPLTSRFFDHARVHYSFAGRNLGFGRAHNLALAQSGWNSLVHFFLNPDIIFLPDVIPYLTERMASQPEVGVLMPRIEYPDGSLQKLCKLLPSPVDLIVRRFLPDSITQLLNKRYELHGLPHDRVTEVPSLSGCFLGARTALLRQIGGFDERYFMYMEDVDLVRRIGNHARTLYDPAVSIVHGYAKGSYHNRKLLMLHLTSAVKYFNKWGWVFDRTRQTRNRAAISQLSRLAQTTGATQPR